MPDFENTIDVNKIKEFADKCTKNDIYVGFLSGGKHLPTRHKGKSGEYESIDGGKPVDEDIETADLARALTYGFKGVPPRPFLYEGLQASKKEILEAYRVQAEKAHAGLKPNWEKVGTKAVGAIQEFVRGDYYRTHVPNSPKTIKWKGSDTPLIDGGDLINSMTFVVNGKVGNEEEQT